MFVNHKKKPNLNLNQYAYISRVINLVHDINFISQRSQIKATVVKMSGFFFIFLIFPVIGKGNTSFLWKINFLKCFLILLWYISVQFSRSAMSISLWPHELQHDRPPCPSPTPRVYPNPCPSIRWCHPTISPSVIPFSFCLQSFPASVSFPMSQVFTSGGQSIEVLASTSVLPMNTQDWSPLGWTGWIFLQPQGLSRVFSNTTVQKHQFFGAQLSL